MKVFEPEKSFKDKVIEITFSIPKGRVTTYGTIATLAGIPRGAQIVGGILHYAIDELGVPWHRVVNRVGFVSTKCFEHPLELQLELMRQEGIEFDENLVVDLEKYGWFGNDKYGTRFLSKSHKKH